MLLNVILWVVGLAFVAFGIWQVRQPLAHYRSLEATQANLRRYDDWRGTRRAVRRGWDYAGDSLDE